MFGYTVFLKIGNLAASSLTDMYKDSYQLIGCEFGFAQGIDIKGQVPRSKRYSLRKRLVWIWKSAISGKAKAILRPN